MDLRSKLAQVNGARLGPASPVAVFDAVPAVSPPVEARRVQTSARARVPASVETQFGPVRFVEQKLGPSARHGRVELAPARGIAGEVLAQLSLDESLREVDGSRMLFLDTETTGLHGGAGTLPFLIGMAWFEGDALVVRQLFLGRPGEEAPLLRMLSDRLSRASCYVTFNGKSFDWPLLRTRLVMNRISQPAPVPHVDLLHCSRRIFKRRLGGTRLQELEARVLDFHRSDDIDGALIPAVYFDWLRRGTTHLLERVLEHNARDVITMAALLAELRRRVEAVCDDDAPEDCLSLAEVALRSGDVTKAEALAVLAAERARVNQTTFDAWALAGKIAAQRSDWGTVVERLGRAVALSGVKSKDVAQVHLTLARVFEHRIRDRARALKHAHLRGQAEESEIHARRLARLTLSRWERDKG